MVADKKFMTDRYYLSGESIQDIAKLAEQTAEVIAEEEDIPLPEAREEVREQIQLEVK